MINQRGQMIYAAYEAARLLTRPMTAALHAGRTIARHDLNPMRDTLPNRVVATICDLPYRALKSYTKQRFNVEGEVSPLSEDVVQSLPFGDLVGFGVAEADEREKLLIAAALSGHHATLLRDTVRGFARDFAPFITDWRDAREVPLSAGDFGLDDYVAYLIAYLETLGPGTHLVATCQAAPPALMAAAVLARSAPELVPASLTLMAGPMDTRINKTLINKVSDYVPLKLLRKTNIQTVPPGFPGAGRKVYPGFFQLSGFMLLNLRPHIEKYGAYLKDGICGDNDALDAFRGFYDEYFAVLDMTESFYLDSLKRIFFEHHLPRGLMTYRGEPIDFGALTNMPLLTVEAEKDNMCALGQTKAAHALCPNIPESRRGHHVQPETGHYGVFSGSRFQRDIYPVVRDFIGAATR
jgi:poly(3-hydroxybutyrate) depolymerase